MRTVTATMLEFLTWVAAKPRTVDDAMEAWKTSCPRLSVWEDAKIDGLITLRPRGADTLVELSDGGRALVD